MVAAVSELQASSNQKQCFDMLIIRLMHIADMPSIPELLKQDSSQNAPKKIEPEEAKVCPNCGAIMVKRRSAYGYFWGCSGYPKCKTIVKF